MPMLTFGRVGKTYRGMPRSVGKVQVQPERTDNKAVCCTPSDNCEKGYTSFIHRFRLDQPHVMIPSIKKAVLVKCMMFG